MHSWNCCRMCLNTNNLNPIFFVPEEHNKYTSIILDSCGIQVDFKDEYPQQICTTCINTINSNYKFRKKCLENQNNLEMQLKDGKIIIKEEFPLKSEVHAVIDISLIIDDSNCDITFEEHNGDISDSKVHNKIENQNSIEDITIEEVFKDDINNIHVKDFNNVTNINHKDNEADVPERKSKRKVIDDENMLDVSFCDDNDEDEEMYLGKYRTQEASEYKNKTNSKLKVIRREKRDKTKTSKRDKQKKETTREPVECEYCHKVLSSRLSIPNHYKIHTGFNIVCEHCGKKFISRRILLMHCRARHGYEKTDKCRYCDYKGSNADQVKIHERLHTGEKPFVCKDCGAAFIRSSTYKQHVATHLTEKNVQCDQCPARFKSVTLMKIHKNKHKPNQYVFKCRICNNSFVRRRNVTRHLERIHKMQPEPGLMERVKIGISELSKT